MQSEYEHQIRSQVIGALKDWASLWERDDAAALGRYYTEAAVLLLPTGGAAVGRGEVGETWSERLASMSDLAMEVESVEAGERLAVVTGRLSYRASEPGGAARVETESFLAVLEQQRNRWLLRSHAFAADPALDPVSESSTTAIRASRVPVSAPQRMLVRLVGEVSGARAEGGDAVGAEGWAGVGGGLGIELDRLIELRAHYWQAGDGPEPVASIGGELRTYLGTLWRFRPHLLLGASRFLGESPPDSMLVPMAGAGLSVALTEGVSLQLAGRDYFVQRPGSREVTTWTAAERTQRWMWGGGLSVAVGRRPTWSDPVVAPERMAHEARISAEIARFMDRWGAARLRSDEEASAALYAPDALLLPVDGGVLSGRSEIEEYLSAPSAPGGGAMAPLAFRAGADLAYVATRVSVPRDEGSAAGTMITVLEREDGAWRIRAQAVRVDSE